MSIQLLRSLLSDLQEGDVLQTMRVEALESVGREGTERFQDYGFAGAPVNAQGLVIEWEGHTFILRAEHVDSRPDLKSWEVCIWHKDGHNITLKGGKVIDVECDIYNVRCKQYNVIASDGMSLDAPVVEASALLKSKTLEIADTARIKGIDFGTHGHEDVESGPDISGGPVSR